MAGKNDEKRLLDLKAALKAAKPRDRVTLDDCAALWGVVKARFVTVSKNFPNWPDKVAVEGNKHLFPAKKAIQSMIAYLERHQKNEKHRASELQQMIGQTDQMADQISGNWTIAELAKVNQVAAELDQRQRDQGLYIPIDDVQRTVGLVFSEISETLSDLSTLVDPHGLLEASTRAMLNENAHKLLLASHAKLKALLSPDVGREPNPKPAKKPGKPRTRRKSSGSGSRKAR